MASDGVQFVPVVVGPVAVSLSGGMVILGKFQLLVGLVVMWLLLVGRWWINCLV